jgi:Winged helix DNA-binding domain
VSRVLTRRELNRALLARQLLLERARLPVPRALERVAGLQAQDPAPPFVGLWTRLEGFRREDLVRLLVRRGVVRAVLMRATVHLVTAGDHALLAPATARVLRAAWRGAPVADGDGLVDEALRLTDEPRSSRDLRERLGEDGWHYARYHAPFVYAPAPEERWAFRRRPDFVAARSWLGEPASDIREGRAHLVRRYLAAFGPATVADLTVWSGLPARELRPALDGIRLRRFHDESGRQLLDLPRAPLPPGDTPAPPRLLPMWDNTLLSHADRTRVISDQHRAALVTGGILFPAFLVDGFVAGRWRLEHARGTSTAVLERFAHLPCGTRDLLRDEGLEAARFVDPEARAHDVRIVAA